MPGTRVAQRAVMSCENPAAVIDHPLVAACHGAVLRDQGPVGFSGRIGLAVSLPGSVSWWVCSFEDRARPLLTSSWPSSLNFLLVLRAAVPGRGAVADCEYWEGDPGLWSRFIRRYGSRKNSISIRLKQSEM